MCIDKRLIANRGEIAIRIARTARALGLRTVAVYSDADRAAPHVRACDDAVAIGGLLPADSYLRIDKVLDAAKTSGAGSVHPGYGFLAENAAFAQAVVDAGRVFVGPPAQAIAAMGDKAEARRRAAALGVPVLAGYDEGQQDDATLRRVAEQLGFPLMIKAAAGGGGRGMRLVRHGAELDSMLANARSEALAAFDDGRLLLERALLAPRHVEIQVLADVHGHAVFLGERDCSVQRRHQKIIEEAPCPVLTPELRRSMGAAALTLCRAIGYVGAGTVECAANGAVAAPMHGRVVQVAVRAGQRVDKGSALATLEAMKMEHALLATAAGKVRAVHVSAGDQVAAGRLMFEIDVESAPARLPPEGRLQ